MPSNYFLTPKKFFSDPKFQKLSANARLLFIYYWNELIFPSEPLPVDENGSPTIADEWEHAQLFLSVNKQSANKARRELHKEGLVKPALDKRGEFTRLVITSPTRYEQPNKGNQLQYEPSQPIPPGSPPPSPDNAPPLPFPKPQPYPIIDES